MFIMILPSSSRYVRRDEWAQQALQYFPRDRGDIVPAAGCTKILPGRRSLGGAVGQRADEEGRLRFVSPTTTSPSKQRLL